MLAAANTVNVDLQDRIEEGVFRQDLATMGLKAQKNFEALLLRYAEVVGEMSKACEALDHVEDYPSRSMLERGVVLLVCIVRRLADIEGIDLSAAAKARWHQIEQKPVAGKGESPKDDNSPLSRVA